MELLKLLERVELLERLEHSQRAGLTGALLRETPLTPFSTFGTSRQEGAAFGTI